MARRGKGSAINRAIPGTLEVEHLPFFTVLKEQSPVCFFSWLQVLLELEGGQRCLGFQQISKQGANPAAPAGIHVTFTLKVMAVIRAT